MSIRSMQEKFVYELSATLDVENTLLEAQQQMLQKATNDQLKQLLKRHIGETEQQVSNLKGLFSSMDQNPSRVTCKAAEGLVSDAQKLLGEVDGNPAIIDTVIANAQLKAEHLEIAIYRGLVQGAQQMGQQEALGVLQQILSQEEQFAQTLEKSIPQLLQQAAKAEQVGV